MAEQEQIDASELVQACIGPAPSEVFSLKKRMPDGSLKDFPVRVRLLSAQENIECLRLAQETAKSKREDPKSYGDIYREAQATELVAAALCHVDQKERADGTKFWRRHFVNTEHLRTAFTENEIALVLNMYELVKAKYSMTEDFSKDEVDMWAARLSDELAAPFFLSSLDAQQWPALLTSLAQRVSSLSKSLGLTLPDLRDSSESEPRTSEDGTTGSTGLQEGSWLEPNERIPSDSLLSSSEARAKVREIEEKAKGKK